MVRKPKVLYKELHSCQVGARAIVTPINHPDTWNVTNTMPVITTEVVRFNEKTGEFETNNSIYIKNNS